MIQIKNMRNEKPSQPWDVKIDKSSWFGNKFWTNKEADRDKACEFYRAWFYKELDDIVMQSELNYLKQLYNKYKKLNLFCWCAPKRCHAETIKEYLDFKNDTKYSIEMEAIKNNELFAPWDFEVGNRFKLYVDYNNCKEWFYKELQSSVIQEELREIEKILDSYNKVILRYNGGSTNYYAKIIKEYLKNDSN